MPVISAGVECCIDEKKSKLRKKRFMHACLSKAR